MKLNRCDLKGCNKEYKEGGIFLKGYRPTNSSGILLPENYFEHDFCSHECFVKYMRWALTRES